MEKRNRIRLAIAAYAYEMRGDSIMSDVAYDKLAKSIDLKTPTDRTDLDIWFICNFDPNTGMWIWKHPELHKLEQIYNRVWGKR